MTEEKTGRPKIPTPPEVAKLQHVDEEPKIVRALEVIAKAVTLYAGKNLAPFDVLLPEPLSESVVKEVKKEAWRYGWVIVDYSERVVGTTGQYMLVLRPVAYRGTGEALMPVAPPPPAPEVDRKRYPNEGQGCYYSDLKVMKSAAGYYIGRESWDVEGGFPEPYSRESDYYGTSEDANAALTAETFERACPENAHAHRTGALPPPKGRGRGRGQ